HDALRICGSAAPAARSARSPFCSTGSATPARRKMRPMNAPAPLLLASDEPAAVRVLRETGSSDFLLTADHAGKLIPASLHNLGVAASDLERHIAWDIGIAGVTE